MQRSRHDGTGVLNMRACGLLLELVFAAYWSTRLISYCTLWSSIWGSHPLEGCCIGRLGLGFRSTCDLLDFHNLATGIG